VEDTHPPAIWPDTGCRETSGLSFTPGLHLSLDFLCNSGINIYELILSRQKRDETVLPVGGGKSIGRLVCSYGDIFLITVC